jgi:periplasmic protein TonB
LDYADTQRSGSKSAVGFGVVVVLHLILGWALLNGLAQRMVEVIKGPIDTKIIEEAAKPPPPPPENLPPPPKFQPPPPSFVPPPEVNVNPPPTPAPVITTTQVAPPPAPFVPAPPPVVAAPPAPPAPPRAAAQPVIANAGECAPGPDDYPAAAKRAEATGITRIRFTVGPDGRLAGAPQVVKSAGSSREHKMLDRVAASKLSECKFKAGIDENGKPVGASFDVDYVWKLE